MSQASKRFVYLLRSLDRADCPYVGVTSNVQARLAAHNAGRSPHTAKHRPWHLVVAVEFATETQAVQFEKYLKSGSGRAFAKRHFGWAWAVSAVVQLTPPEQTNNPVRGVAARRGRRADCSVARGAQPVAL